ncbi:non-specific serine/threonine protein kinase [Anaeramoeba ignava]|uniref:Non-specific serine/threonine protein kinase n=1 Tax=Anaeramoeba ignava TaxID=1746090 RepID=A0A9Q0LLT1_ANAIG|nr:non-specific serine/threonine protein kinase [Anaeramoeba ignava]
MDQILRITNNIKISAEIEQKPKKTNKKTKKAKNTPKTNDFKFLNTLQKGQNSEIYLVENEKDKKQYVLKLIKKNSISNDKDLQRLFAEKTILCEIKNPFIVQLHHSFLTETDFCFLIDYINGGDLYQILNYVHSFTENEIKFFAAELILALKAIHKANYIYRDLKPENILIDRTGHIHLTDFGVSKKLEKNERTNSFCGSLEYLAPEVLKNQKYGFEIDFWSLGMVLYEMFYGIPPFYSQNLREMQKNILNQEVNFEGVCSSEFKDLITKLLSKDPKKRLGSSKKGIKEIMKHPFFKEINWTNFSNKKSQPQFIPSFFFNQENLIQNENLELKKNSFPSLEKTNPTCLDKILFKDFEYDFRK